MVKFLWKMIGTTPSRNDESREKFWTAFRRYWVAGTLGAFFTGIARSIPMHLQQISWPFESDYTIDLFVRYGYLLWLLAYFFISNLEIDQSTRTNQWDIPYDVLQSACALTAAFFLGFILPDMRYGLIAYTVTNAAIFVICVFSLIWFRKGAPNAINWLRWAGAIISAISFFLALLFMFVSMAQTLVLLIFALLLGILWILLYGYIRLRVDKPTGQGEATGGSAVSPGQNSN